MADDLDLENMQRRSHSSREGFSKSNGAYETEQLKKEWYQYALASIEKMHKMIEDVRRIDLENAKQDLKERINKLEERLEDFQRDAFAPLEKAVNSLETSVRTLTVKLGLWGIIGGVIGTGIINFMFWLLREYLTKVGP